MAASVYSLTTQDFVLQENTLLNTIQGYSFVMFMTEKCTFCHQFMPQFRTLPGKLYGVTFAVCSVDGQNAEIHKMSLSSTSPIKNAPTFIFYNNGVPFAEYKGERNVAKVVAFIQGAVGECQRQAQQTQQQQPQQLRSRIQTPSQAPNEFIQRQMPQIPGRAPVVSQHQAQAPAVTYKISPTTGVKEFETSYGRPYNTTNDQEFLDYERAYLEKK
jgi:hypothetical protein